MVIRLVAGAVVLACCGLQLPTAAPVHDRREAVIAERGRDAQMTAAERADIEARTAWVRATFGSGADAGR